MARSKDFRRIENGPVLVETQEPWGYPHLLIRQLFPELNIKINQKPKR